VTDRARHDDVIVPREDGSDIVHGFPGGNADGLLLQEYGWPPSWATPTSKETRVRSDSFSNISATLLRARIDASLRSPLLIRRASMKTDDNSFVFQRAKETRSFFIIPVQDVTEG